MSLKIGIIYCAFNTEDYVNASLAPWGRARASNLDGHDFIICAINVPFVGFENEKPDHTRMILEESLERGSIDHLIKSDEPMRETEARGAALRWLKAQGVDVTLMVDSDEFYTEKQITDIFAFVVAQPFCTWFRIALRNAVFTPDQYLIEPFTPPRIHRIKASSYQAHSFSQDNDIAYGGTITRDIISQERFASMTIPKEVAWVKHFSWLNDDRSRRKIDYQLRGRGWPVCSFAWDINKGLVFNEAYYKALGQSLPEVARDEH